VIGDNKPLRNCQFSLTKLIYAMSAASIVTYVAAAIGIHAFWPNSTRYDLTLLYGFPVTLLVFVFIMVGIILFYKPIGVIFHSSSSTPPENSRSSNLLKDLAIGLLVGLACFVIAVPMLLRGDTQSRVIARLVVAAYELSPVAILGVVLLVVALPVSGEMVFRGIVFRTLAEYATIPAAVIGNSLVFAYFWPVYNWPLRVLIGAALGLLYYRTQSLVSSIIANAAFTSCICAFTVYNSLART